MSIDLKLLEQRELLISFMNWYNPQNEGSEIDWIDIEEIDAYLISVIRPLTNDTLND